MVVKDNLQLTGKQWKTFSRMNFFLLVTYLLPFIDSTGISARRIPDYGITKDDLAEAVDFVQFITNLSKTLESNIREKVGIDFGSPSFGLDIAYRPEDKAMERGRDALLAMKTTIQLANSFCTSFKVNYDDCFKTVAKFSIRDSPLKSICDRLEKVCSPEEHRFMYRSAEGTCNNAKKGRIGESFTGYSRLLPSVYSDHIHLTRRAIDRSDLPNARKVSSSVVHNKEILNDRFTLAVPLWGQFLEHDLSRFASPMMYHFDDSFDCCEKNGFLLSPRYHHPLCMPIRVPWDDKPYSSKGLRCINYARSLPAVQPNCHFGGINQLNQATHFLDASQIYGSTFNKTATLRSFTNGMLRSHRVDDRSFLPLSKQPTRDCRVMENAACFEAGDPRSNQHPLIVAMQTLWLREHNRIAAELATINKEWDDETLFQETRRIVIAEVQHITYDHWVPKLLGERSKQKIVGVKNYVEAVNPSISNGFATAAIRSLYSMFSNSIRLVNDDRDSTQSSSINLHEHFNNPNIILDSKLFDSLVRGLTTQSSGNVDRQYAEDLSTNLFTNDRFGYDILSLDIQRSRDHGLPSYNAYRSHCGLKKVMKIKDLAHHMTIGNAELLGTLYRSPDDIDLIVGGLMETPKPGSQLGPTFTCLLEDQLRRTRQGDRYFYTNEGQPKPFSVTQLKEIQKVTLARVICDNSDGIKRMQPDAFMKITRSNELVDCNSAAIPRIDLRHWKEMPRYHI